MALAAVSCSPVGPAPSDNDRVRDRLADASAAASDPTPGPMLSDSPPPLNDLEARIIDALAAVGVEAQRGEHSLHGAAIWAQFEDGTSMQTYATPTETHGGEYDVSDERIIQGIEVRTLRIPAVRFGNSSSAPASPTR